MEKIDWDSMTADEFDHEAAEAMEAALETLRKNKGGRWRLESHKADKVGIDNRLICEVSFPKGPAQRLYVRGDAMGDPLGRLPLVRDSRAGLEELRKRVSEKEFLVACLATWIYRYAIYYDLR